jgi:putative IMPACT (imprinted ancient) family translation regulator
MADSNNDSLERALADIEILQAAYPDEVDFRVVGTKFPLHATLRLDDDSSIVLEFVDGYPMQSGVQVSSYRSSEKNRIDAAARAVRQVAEECLEDEIEGGLACCAAAMERWQEYEQQQQADKEEEVVDSIQINPPSRQYEWFTGEPFMDRKSMFVAHACRVASEQEVREALTQLLSSSSKIQRATHNMYAWRLTEALKDGNLILKHDNDDDGEDAAGSRMALLLHQRKEDGVLVVVSRWFGGIHLGPKRFAHIVNVSRELLLQCHEQAWKKQVD